MAKYQGFNPGSAGSGAAYTYDANGNLKTDPYKGITDIKYNHLNLPTLINFGSSGKDSLLYDFAGKKLAKLVLPTTTAGYTQNYVDGIEYRTEGGTSTLNLEAIYHPEGRITPNGAVYQYEYSIKDHLGNTRLTFADLNANSIVDVPGDILQENHYYPFGLNMNYGWLNATALDNRYQYNGKEWNDDFGLNWNDYGARWYDAAVGRWWSVDLLAEKYPNWSSYIYAVDNPIIFIDPDGKDIIISIKGRGENVDAKRQEHLSQLQRLTNDKLTMGEDGKVNIATKATGRLSDLSKAGGTMLIRNLINGIEQEDGTVKNFTVTIVEGINNGIDPVNSNGVTTDESVENSENGTGTGSKITFNINKKGDNVVNADNTTGRPPRIGLAHELVHAKNNMMGANKRSTITDTNDPDTSRNGNVEKMSQEEINVRTEENIIRKEQKVKPRQLGGQ